MEELGYRILGYEWIFEVLLEFLRRLIPLEELQIDGAFWLKDYWVEILLPLRLDLRVLRVLSGSMPTPNVT